MTNPKSEHVNETAKTEHIAADMYSSATKTGQPDTGDVVAWRWRDNEHEAWNHINWNPQHMDYGIIEPLVRLSDYQALKAQLEAAERERDEGLALVNYAEDVSKAVDTRATNAEAANAALKAELYLTRNARDNIEDGLHEASSRAEARVKSLAGHVEQLVGLLDIIKEHWIDYDHVYSNSVYDARAALDPHQ